MMIFVISFIVVLAVNAACFSWFAASLYMHWWAFTGIMLVVFVGGTISFEIYFRIIGKKYDGLLGQYRKQKSNSQ